MITLPLRTRLVIAGVLLAGCTNTIPVISTSIECPVKQEDLAAKCAEPATIATGATYQDMIRIAIADRKNLSECEKNRQYLQNSINECNAAIRKHNEKIDEFNKKYAGKP
jgi:peptidoglycan hydrolase CwlO-like protein